MTFITEYLAAMGTIPCKIIKDIICEEPVPDPSPAKTEETTARVNKVIDTRTDEVTVQIY